MQLKKIIITAFLSVQTVYCWWCFFEAKRLPYDENYGILLHAVLISFAAWIVIRIFKAKWFGQFGLYKPVSWTWLIIGSPLTFILMFFFYSNLFGSLAT
jgi:hypothetical protein